MNTFSAKEYEVHIELAVDILKAQDRTLIEHLKEFLQNLPSPKLIQTVLTITFYRLAETDIASCQWILQQRDCLLPDLDLTQLATSVALSKLQSQGYLPNRDFKIEPDGHLRLVNAAAIELIIDSSAGDRLLLASLFQDQSPHWVE